MEEMPKMPEGSGEEERAVRPVATRSLTDFSAKELADLVASRIDGTQGSLYKILKAAHGEILARLEQNAILLKENAELHDDLAFMGASHTAGGDLIIAMPKYHAAHRCKNHREEDWRKQDLDRCVPCLLERIAELEKK